MKKLLALFFAVFVLSGCGAIDYTEDSFRAGANKKISALTEDTAPTSDDLVTTVNDPGGTPASRKATVANLPKGMTHTDIGTPGTGADHSYIDQDVSTAGNPSFLSGHATGGNLAAANAQVTKKWITAMPYVADVTSVIHGGIHYICKASHTAGDLDDEPGVGAVSDTYWYPVATLTTPGVIVRTVGPDACTVTNITKSAAYTIGTDSLCECYGATITVESAAVITACDAIDAAMKFCVKTFGAIAVSVDPQADDLIRRDGVAQADGEQITNTSTTGDLTCFDALEDLTGWSASTGSPDGDHWINGG